MYFNTLNGKLFCKECFDGSVHSLPIDRTMLSAMRHIVFSKFENIYKFSIPDEKAEQLSTVTEKFISAQTEYSFRTLEFYKQIKLG